ncbi:MAG: YihY/virulence factor BrkB family protein [Saprospiraceae bacterium]|nr:YihY/virulence factor BrkB family protein [Saprospiraceae bacterium]MDW8231093.1 YihY/virulence factor BrkB family protein [Saprospiraceae bacterium]
MPKRRLQRIQEYVERHPLLERIITWSKTHSLPGLKRIPLYNLLGFIRDELRNDDLMTRANSIAFNLFLAIFPSIIALFTLLAYTPLYENFDEVLAEAIERVMPGSAGQLIFSTIEDIATRQRSGLLSLGFFLAVWFASNGMLSLMEGFEKEHQLTFRRRSLLEKRLVAIQLTFLLGLVLIGDVVLVILGNLLLGALFAFVKAGLFTRLILFAFRWIVIIALFYTGYSIIYRYGAATRRPLPFFNPGAMLATLLSILVSWGFSFYVDNFGSYNKVYGSIGALIAFMIWLQLNCAILLIGFELNAGVAVLRDRRRAKEEGKAS